jgi:hypothetical protein
LSSSKCADKQEQYGHCREKDDGDVVVMAEQQRQSDNQDDGDEEFRCVADEEVPPEETKGPDTAGYRSHSSTLSDATASVG